MKSFKNILIVITLFTITSGYAKRTGVSGVTIPAVQSAPVIPKTPAIQPISKPQPSMVQPKTYAQALNAIRAQTLPFRIVTNNTFTPEFINFVKSLNLSEIEMNALLEAGAYLHASWTGNNQRDNETINSFKNNIAIILQKSPIASVQPKRKISTSPQCITHEAIIILDPDKAERIDNKTRAMVLEAETALLNKAAPIIISSNVLEIIINIMHRIGPKNLQQLHTMIHTTANINAVKNLAQTFIQSYKIDEILLDIIYASIINFDNNEFNCYFHKSTNLILLIPKEYIQNNVPSAANLGLYDQAQACGFNPNVLTAIDNISVNTLLQKLQTLPISVNRETFITDLSSLFSPQKRNGELIFPEQNVKWAIYLTGHGQPGQIKEDSDSQLEQKLLQKAKENLSTWQQILALDKKNSNAQKYIPYYESEIQKYEKLLQNKKNFTESTLSPESTEVAGLHLDEFSRLMKYFNQSLDVAYLHYTTCFGGGYNQTFVNDILTSLDVNFITSAEGIHESATTAIARILVPNSSGTQLVLRKQTFTDFFKLLRSFICQPEEFVKIKGIKKEPVAQILKVLLPDMKPYNQPFVRFPGAGVFGALSLGQNAKVLTKTIVKAHEIENKSIDITDTNINMVIVESSRINVPLNFGRNTQCAIVSPSPKVLTKSYEAIHIFKEINFTNTLQLLLFNFINLNTRFYPQTFIVKTLKGCTIAGVATQHGDVIRNLIIQIKGIKGTSFEQPKNVLQYGRLTSQDVYYYGGANVSISFQLRDVIYEKIIGITRLDSPDLKNNLQSITFNQLAETTDMNMNTLAANFLTPQEIIEMKKPITLDNIIEFIDHKIDIQQPSLQETEVSSEEMLEFTKRQPK